MSQRRAVCLRCLHCATSPKSHSFVTLQYRMLVEILVPIQNSVQASRVDSKRRTTRGIAACNCARLIARVTHRRSFVPWLAATAYVAPARVYTRALANQIASLSLGFVTRKKRDRLASIISTTSRTRASRIPDACAALGLWGDSRTSKSRPWAPAWRRKAATVL